MANVVLWGGLKSLAGGTTELQSNCETVLELLDELGDKFPGLKHRIDRGVSVSIDGMVFRNQWFAKIDTNSEVYILPRLSGG